MARLGGGLNLREIDKTWYLVMPREISWRSPQGHIDRIFGDSNICIALEYKGQNFTVKNTFPLRTSNYTLQGNGNIEVIQLLLNLIKYICKNVCIKLNGKGQKESDENKLWTHYLLLGFQLTLRLCEEFFCIVCHLCLYNSFQN